MKSRFIVACAGSGKTTTIINSVLSSNSQKKILITTFTDENCDEIKRKFVFQKGFVPANVDILPWFSFEIKHLIKPYLHPMIGNTFSGVDLVPNKSVPYTSQTEKKHYISKNNKIYSDKIALLAYNTIIREQNVLKRLSAIYDEIFVDEFQDFVGYDLEIVKHLMENGFKMLIVGDPRQKTYSTHFSVKNKKYSDDQESYITKECALLCDIDYNTLNCSFRCPESIISYASTIFKEYPVSHSIVPQNDIDGIYLVETTKIKDFLEIENAVVQLRYNSKSQVYPLKKVFTYGKSKGATYENVLIYPTTDIKNALLNDDFSKIKSRSTLSKLYVALTRAKHKVGIVIADSDIIKNKNSNLRIW